MDQPHIDLRERQFRMIINPENNQNYNERKVAFEAAKDKLLKEPAGDVKKEYNVGCFQKSDWEFIHAELMKDGSLEDNIPTDKCECINDCLQSDVRGVYLLTETEAAELRENPKVDYVNIKASSYPGTYKINPDELIDSPVYRYASTVKNQQQITSSLLTHNPAPASLLNRCSSQLYRGTAKKNPWVTLGNPQTIVDDRIYQYGTGVDVDVIVCDTAGWLGHIEFCNPSGITNIKALDVNAAGYVGGNSSTVAPSNFIGGNVLKSGFATSATTGICNVLDLVLDAPYYIDPAWFEASPSTRLTTRWDGTTVPVESVAKEWWSDSTKRSATYASIGTVTIPTLYTRANCNGSNTSRLPSAPFLPDSHGTCCASQAYGRQYGWAYNANKWYLNLYGYHGMGLNDADGFDVQKIFHENKPNRASDNTKNPTISSNSWGRRFGTSTVGSSGYYYYRPSTVDGTTSGVQYTSWDMDGNTDGTGGTAPRFMTNRTLDSQSSGIQCEPVSGSAITGLNDLITSGVIFVNTAGNRNQKQVKSDHPDYNNYFSSSNNTALSASTFFFSYDQITYRQTLNRGGYPSAIPGIITVGALDDVFTREYSIDVSNSGASAYNLSGSDRNGLVSGNNVTVNIEVGDTIEFVVNASGHPFYIRVSNGGSEVSTPAATGQGSETGTVTWIPNTVGTYYYQCGNHSSMIGTITVSASSGKEQKVNYSGSGNHVDCYATADRSLAAAAGGSYGRYDSFYTYDSTQSVFSADQYFNGTSSACPITAGIIATKLETNRTWTYTDVKNWLTTNVGQQDTADFYYGSESTSANDTTWSDQNSLQGGPAIVAYDAPTSDTTAPTLSSSVPADGATGIAINTNIVLNFSESVTAQSAKNIVIYKTSDDSTVETISVTSGQVTGSGSSQITVNPSSNFDTNTSYYILIDSASFKDAAGNSYAGISDKTSLNFTTVVPDTTDPTLISSSPANGATGVAVDVNIILNFSEVVDAESGNIIIYKESDDSVIETIDVTSGQVTGSGSSQITVNPNSDLDVSTSYYIQIAATAFDDAAGNSYAGISDKTSLRFTTSSGGAGSVSGFTFSGANLTFSGNITINI